MFSFLNVVLCFSEEIYWNEQKEQKITPNQPKKRHKSKETWGCLAYCPLGPSASLFMCSVSGEIVGIMSDVQSPQNFSHNLSKLQVPSLWSQ